MGGKLTLVIKSKEGRLAACKIHTSLLEQTFNDIELLNENSMRQALKSLENHDKTTSFPILADLTASVLPPTTSLNKVNYDIVKTHNDYENSAALPAPYYYGILFFDYQRQELICDNDSSCFSLLSSAKLKSEYEHYIEKGERPEFISLSDGIRTAVPVFEQYNMVYPEICRLRSVLAQFGNIYKKGQQLNVSPENIRLDLFEVLAQLYGEDLRGKGADYLRALQKKRDQENAHKFGLDLSGYSDLEIEVPGWNFYSGRTTYESHMVLASYMAQYNAFDATTQEAWNQFLEERYNSEQPS